MNESTTEHADEGSPGMGVAPGRDAEGTCGWDDRQAVATFVGCVILVLLAYALQTQHVWEDYFITFRHSRNLAEGHGLLYTPGERVHGFTSPINVLLPAFFHYITGCRTYAPALWLWRMISIAAYAAAGVVFLRLMRGDRRADRITQVFFALYLLSEAKSIAYSMNGQEAAFMLLCLAICFTCALEGMQQRWLLMGVGWGAFMWTRPDGCVYVTAFAVLSLVLEPKAWQQVLAAIAKSAAVCTGLYGPWFTWTWWYYGTPIPHTILAKGTNPETVGLPPLIALGTYLASFWHSACVVFQPIYADLFFGWPAWVGLFGAACALIGCVWCLIPSQDRLGRAASLMFIMLSLYLALIDFKVGLVFPWYMPPVAVCGLLVLARAIHRVASLSPPTRAQAWACGLGTLFLVPMLILYALTVIQIRIQQREIEFGTRVPIGLYLRENVKPNETVYLECLGYIGYFSNAHMLDYPGLATPSVAQLKSRENLSFGEVIPRLKPDWLVLRRQRANDVGDLPGVLDAYEVAKLFDATPRLEQYRTIPGRNYLLWDSQFAVLKRRHDAPAETTSGLPAPVPPTTAPEPRAP